MAVRPNKKLDLVLVGVLGLWLGCLRDGGYSGSLLQTVLGWANLKEQIIGEGQNYRVLFFGLTVAQLFAASGKCGLVEVSRKWSGWLCLSLLA